MVASGNDFVVVRLSAGAGYLKRLARKICDRKYGIGADGMLVLGKSKRADIRMRIFNADGSEAQMCGNGARAAALYASRQSSTLLRRLDMETKAGVIEARINAGNIKIKLTEPGNIRLNLPVKVNNRILRVNFINTGVPHAVIFVEGLRKLDVKSLGRQIRFHDRFKPDGTNVDFVETLKSDYIKVRTYERGVEDETLACGTGSVASALITASLLVKAGKGIMRVMTASGQILKVYFKKTTAGFEDVWLEGKAEKVCKGEYYV